MDCCSGKKHEKTGHTEQETDNKEGLGNNNLLILAGAAIAIIILVVAFVPK